MLVDEIKRRMFAAMKAKNTVEKEILRVALGEISRSGGPETDQAASAVLRKLVKSNEESLSVTQDDEQKRVLKQEIDIVQALLPASLGVEQIVGALAPVREEIAGAKADGAATGIAMKHLKSQALSVDGKDVAQAVRQIRST